MAWNGLPDVPEREGFHVLRSRESGQMIAFRWSPEAQLFFLGEWGFVPASIAKKHEYVGRCVVLPPGFVA